MYSVHKRTESGPDISFYIYLNSNNQFHNCNFSHVLFSNICIRYRFGPDYNYMRFPVCLLVTYGSPIIHLGELVRSGQVNQISQISHSGLIKFKVLFTEEFTILLNQVKERSDFGFGLDMNQLFLYNRPVTLITLIKWPILPKIQKPVN